MNYMYTKDNDMVLVVEKINDHQYIVQKVFVDSEGNETLSSEKYVETSLKEKPDLRTWRTSELEKLEKIEKNTIERIEKSLKELKSEYIDSSIPWASSKTAKTYVPCFLTTLFSPEEETPCI